MRDIKLVLTDLDGTVVQFAKHEVSEVVRQAVIACENAGVMVVPVTGRYREYALPVLELLGFDDYGIFDNGATIQHCKTGEIIWSKWLTPVIIKRVASAIAPYARIIDYGPDHAEHSVASDELELIACVSQPASHIYALIDKANIDTVFQELGRWQDITFYAAPSTEEEFPDALGIQINIVGASKFHAVEVLREILGIDKKHTLAIGDGANDLPLFENAGLKIAMGNSTNELKEQADYVVAAVENDGFAEAMQRFVLAYM